jgi:hypothetical protein
LIDLVARLPPTIALGVRLELMKDTVFAKLRREHLEEVLACFQPVLLEPGVALQRAGLTVPFYVIDGVRSDPDLVFGERAKADVLTDGWCEGWRLSRNMLHILLDENADLRATLIREADLIGSSDAFLEWVRVGDSDDESTPA